MMVFVLEEAQKAGDIFSISLNLLALANGPLDISHDIAVDLFVADLLLQLSLQHIALPLQIFQFRNVLLIAVEPAVYFKRAGQWLIAHHGHVENLHVLISKLKLNLDVGGGLDNGIVV